MDEAVSYEDHPINPNWRLHDELTVDDAAALVAEEDPAWISRCINDTFFDENFSHVVAARKALINAINSGKLKATKYFQKTTALTAVEKGDSDHAGSDAEGIVTKDQNGNSYILERTPDWSKTTIDLEVLRTWLRSRGKVDGFFFFDGAETPGYLDPNHPRYAPKLAAAIDAWNAISVVPPGKHPKQALVRWLREHAAQYGITDEEGKPNETAIGEIAKVVNWQEKGGAPRTPRR